MAWLRWFSLGLLLGLSALSLWRRLDHSTQGIAADFVQQFENASLRRPDPDVFAVRDVSISGLSKPSITVQQPSRIAWDLTVPGNAWVEAELALQEAAWTLAGDGVLFRIGISFDGRYDELVTQVVNPFVLPDDRRWVPVVADLSPYAGRAVSLIFNTRPGLEGDNRDHDLAVWGAPRVATR
ncbi:MAG: hypothetical protein H0W08_08600 [Acidobacteria bacterium]|nr:hypothetical protein [Acidobacteriota bacterium]